MWFNGFNNICMNLKFCFYCNMLLYNTLLVVLHWWCYSNASECCLASTLRVLHPESTLDSTLWRVKFVGVAVGKKPVKCVPPPTEQIAFPSRYISTWRTMCFGGYIGPNYVEYIPRSFLLTFVVRNIGLT